MAMPTTAQPLAPRTRRARNRAEMHAAILEAARAVMRQEGVAALNLNKVAAHIGIKPPSLYEYFDGKMAVYDALFRLGFELFAARITPTLAHARTWQESLRGAIETYMQFALDCPELFQLCFERPVPGFVPSAESMQVSWTLLQASQEQIARIMQEQGGWTGMTPAQANDLGIALMHGLTAQHLANEPHLPVGQGRFGSLIPAVLALFDGAWQNADRVPVRPSARKIRRRGKESRK